MRIEEGKTYRSAKGEKIGPMMEFESKSFPNSFIRKQGDGFVWGEDGACSYNAEGEKGPYHLVSEWTDEGPVRTVTRHEIIPGTYDGVSVNVGPEGELFIEVTPMATRDPARLDRAAAVLTALAGALRDEQ